ncbi:MAG: galactose mutarotase [Oscillospiraceae bacterium]|jgi:aldose 1-epimerase|nr:galactose mutarotase [Oscillospiraceae bacterium]
MVTKKVFGILPDGRFVHLLKIEAQGGRYANILTYGAALQALVVPDKNGVPGDVVLGFDTFEGYLNDKDFHGRTVGRYANRIGGGGFMLGDAFYRVPENVNAVFLHGGGEFSGAIWDFEISGEQSVTLSYTSPVSYGFPGRVRAQVTYTFDGSELNIDYFAKTDEPTVLNFTNHTYWTLNTYGEILRHILQADADFYQPIDPRLLPDGEPCAVDGTPFDFREATGLGERIRERNTQLRLADGYDHHFCLNSGGKVQVSSLSGRTLTMTTDMPGFQLYTGNFLSGKIGKRGRSLARRCGFCLETQFPPDTPNSARAADCVFSPNRPYRSRTTYRFGVVE